MSRTTANLLLVGAAIVALLGGYWAAQLLHSTPATSGDSAGFIEVTGTDLDGAPRKLSELRGTVTVVNFWATWCPPCREEIPLFTDTQSQLAARGLQIVGVAIDEPAEVRAYRQEVKINYPLLIADPSVYKAMQAYGNTAGGLPFSVVLDRAGQVRSRKLGAFRGNELQEAVLPLLASPAK
jgi:peroxiredoxin